MVSVIFRTRILFVLIPLLGANEGFTQGRQLSPIELFRRCNIHFANQPLKINGEVESLIRSNRKDPIEACLEILERGFLSDTGELKNDSPTGRAILKTFNSFHRTWFTANTIEQIQDYSEEVARGTVDHYDPNEPALTLTRALLGSQVPYKEVLTGTQGVSAIREEDQSILSQFGFTTKNAWRRFGAQISHESKVVTRNRDDGWIQDVSKRQAADIIELPIIQLGTLKGITLNTQSTILKNLYLKPVSGDANTWAGHVQPHLNFEYDFFKHRGGGILGSNIFYLLNNGHSLGQISNGTTKLPRRWIQSAMESLLCTSFPALRENDIRSLVRTNSTAPFRNAASCVQCHATLDQAAQTARNLVVGATDYTNLIRKNASGGDDDFFNRYPLVVTSFKSIKNSSGEWLSEPVNDFHLQQPNGRLYFRSINGQLISKNVQSIADLGRAMEETDDFYTCAAKRYFKYLTGIDVSLIDKTNPANSSLIRQLSPIDFEYRDFVESLGRDLKRNQSLFELIKAIISSPYYRTRHETNSEGGG